MIAMNYAAMGQGSARFMATYSQLSALVDRTKQLTARALATWDPNTDSGRSFHANIADIDNRNNHIAGIMRSCGATIDEICTNTQQVETTAQNNFMSRMK